MSNDEGEEKAETASQSNPASEIGSKERFDYAWKHFALIADQRVKTFHFYVIVLAGSFAWTLPLLNDATMRTQDFFGLGVIHAVIAYSFFMIDRRGCELLDIATRALVEFESSSAFAGKRTLLLEDHKRNLESNGKRPTYRMAFTLLFRMHLYCGIVLALVPEWLSPYGKNNINLIARAVRSCIQ